jgi:Na+/H+ antiporter NhaC
MKLDAALDAWTDGLKSMLLACVILVMAWSLGALCKELHTAHVVVSLVGDSMPVGLLGTVVFLVAAAISFATGTSWGTMAILFPLVVPLAVQLAPGDTHALLGAISSILAGAVFGDHCSPISDTTIMSSMASSCDHVDHVRTQLPYALLVGTVCILVCELPTGFGLYPPWVALLLGAITLVAIVTFVGKKVPDHDPR